MRRGVAVVTGSGRGIGLRTAIALAAAGYETFATSRRIREELAAAAARGDGRLHPRELDVRDGARSEALLAEAAAHGPLQVLVNNAGVTVNGLFETVSEESLREGIETNFIGPWRLTQQAIPHMRKARPATVVQISSRVGRIGFPLLAGYAATKHALEGFSEAIRHELAPLGIRVVLIEPGGVRTSMHTGSAASDRLLFAGREGAAIERMVTRSRGYVSRRGLDPDAVARRVLKVVESPNPRLRHALGVDARVPLTLKRLLPFRLIETKVARILIDAGYPAED